MEINVGARKMFSGMIGSEATNCSQSKKAAKVTTETTRMAISEGVDHPTAGARLQSVSTERS